MCVEIPVETPAVNMYYINDIEQLLHWRYPHVYLCLECTCLQGHHVYTVYVVIFKLRYHTFFKDECFAVNKCTAKSAKFTSLENYCIYGMHVSDT